jgi:hypothetical protein
MSLSPIKLSEVDFVEPASRSRHIEFLSNDEAFRRFSEFCIYLYCLSAALSIAASQAAIVLLLTGWVLHRSVRDRSAAFLVPTPGAAMLLPPILVWVVCSLLAACIGVDAAQAMPEVGRSAVFALSPFCIASVVSAERDACARMTRVRKYLTLLFLSQAIASLHTILSYASGFDLPPRIPGAVTESGQIALLLPILIVCLLSRISFRTSLVHPSALIPLFITLSIGVSLVVLSWPHLIPHVSGSTAQSVAVVAAVMSALLLRLKTRETPRLRHNGEILLLLVLIAAAFLLNLKRGPWMGVALAVAVTGVFLSRFGLIASVVTASVVVGFVTPIRARILSSLSDFEITGGRQSMWEIGAELAKRFPLGIGPDNARMIREMDPSLPEMHLHMHNNFLNVLVESGWLGLMAYVWWLYVLLSIAFRSFGGVGRKRTEAQFLALGIGAGLLSWQIAGLVEYNFGDGEVRVLSFFLMGLLISMPLSATSTSSADDAEHVNAC